MGIAKAMYNAFLSSEKKRILVDFLVEPRNNESMVFHESMGFKSIGDFIRLKNGMCAEVYEYASLKKA
jgi:L-amino acid N-acyltransferase YncA